MAKKEVADDLSQILWENGTNFLIRNNNAIPVDSLVGKIVALYFAGFWFRACQSFTTVLVELYKQLGWTESDKFEAVYISYDFSEESFNEYYSEMPWLAVPFSDSRTRERLKNSYNVLEFPTLVILDENGKVRSNDATEIVWDYGAEAFPFTSERIKFLEGGDNRVQTVSSLLDFTNYLIKKDGNQDQSETQYGEEFEEMPWLAMPFTEENINNAEKLTLQFKLETLPGLVIIRLNGKASITNPVELITKHGIIAFPFSRKLAMFAEHDKQRREAETLGSLLASEYEDIVMGKDGSNRRVSELFEDHILLYFSAEHFTESETFLKRLMKTYNEMEKHEKYTVIFVSRDLDIEKSVWYFLKMPWYALPYEGKMSSRLIEWFNILKHPKVVVIGPFGSSMTTKGVHMIKNFGADAYPFDEDHVETLAGKAVTSDEGWQRKLKSVKHEHELELIYRTKFHCSQCQIGGSSWFYSCEDCNFKLHTHCVGPLREEDEPNHDDPSEEEDEHDNEEDHADDH